MNDFIEKLRVQVLKHCIKHNISVRQFLIGLGEDGIINWTTLTRNASNKKGQLGLLLKLIKYFNYD